MAPASRVMRLLDAPRCRRRAQLWPCQPPIHPGYIRSANQMPTIRPVAYQAPCTHQRMITTYGWKGHEPMTGASSVQDTSNAMATVPDDVLVGELPEETVLLAVKTGEYYDLNEVGARMFTLVQQYSDLDEVVGVLIDEYEVEEERLRTDLHSLIDRLSTLGLLQLRDGSAS